MKTPHQKIKVGGRISGVSSISIVFGYARVSSTVLPVYDAGVMKWIGQQGGGDLLPCYYHYAVAPVS